MPGRALTSTTYSPIAQIIATQYGLLISQAARKAETIQSNTVEDIQAEGKRINAGSRPTSRRQVLSHEVGRQAEFRDMKAA